FFFSSRRRHTRFSRDWSSDVCSSDLVGRAHLHRCRQVEDHLFLWCRLPDLRHCIRHFFGKLHFSAGKHFRRILVDPVHFRRLRRQFLHPFSALNRNVDRKSTRLNSSHVKIS